MVRFFIEDCSQGLHPGFVAVNQFGPQQESTILIIQSVLLFSVKQVI